MLSSGFNCVSPAEVNVYVSCNSLNVFSLIHLSCQKKQREDLFFKIIIIHIGALSVAFILQNTIPV